MSAYKHTVEFSLAAMKLEGVSLIGVSLGLTGHAWVGDGADWSIG